MYHARRFPAASDEAKGNLTLVAVALVIAAGCRPGMDVPPRPDAVIAADAVRESSGLVASRRFSGVFWTHNDSGNEAVLFAIDGEGGLIRAYSVAGAVNHDWEDIAVDGQGNLFLLDNTSKTEADGSDHIYRFPEPDPYSDDSVGPVQRIDLEFPSGSGPYDSEALFVDDDRIYLVTKPWDGSFPRIYRTDSTTTGELSFVGEIPVPVMVTGADLTPDGRRLVLSSYRALLIYDDPDWPETLGDGPLVCPLNAGQIEGVAWKRDQILLTNEQRQIYTVAESQWRQRHAPFVRAPAATVPFMDHPPAPELSLQKWARGRWLTEWLSEGGTRLGRIVRTPGAIHVGLQLPEELALRQGELLPSSRFEQWFAPGTVYLLLNPGGDRPLWYSPDDRCLVIYCDAAGQPASSALVLKTATVVESSESPAPGVEVVEAAGHLLVTVTSEAPGFAALDEQGSMGFNAIIVDSNRQILSWAPLSRRFSWDQPSAWGLLRFKH